jgi:hypothetical protein
MMVAIRGIDLLDASDAPARRMIRTGTC